MQRPQTFFLLIAIVAGGCDGVLAVNGRVVDEAGLPISGAMVSAYSAFPQNVADDQGCFRLGKLTGWSKHRAPFLVQAAGHETYLDMIEAPGFHQVVVHLPREGQRTPAVAEIVSSLSSCPGPRENAAQQGVSFILL